MGLPSGTFSQTYQQDKAVFRTRLHWVLLGLGILFLIALPQVAPPFFRSTLILSGIYIIGVLGVNILTGLTGQITLGQSAFAAVGAYTTAILAYHLGFSFWAALPLAILGAGVVGLVFGIPSVRIKGLYLAMATIAAQFIIMYGISHAGNITRTTVGIYVDPVQLGSIVFDNDRKFYYLLLGFVLLAIFVAHNIARSALGRAFVAIRDNDLAAEVMGISLAKYKLLAFFIGCAFGGLAGALYVAWLTVITPDPFTFTESVWYLGMVIVGGMGSTLGATIGALLLTFLTQYTTYIFSALAGTMPNAAGLITAIRLTVFGLIVAGFLIFEPRGIAHRWHLLKAYYRLWPFAY